MDAQEVAHELGLPAARELLERAGLVRLAYNGSDGLPRVVPVGFWWNGEEVVVCTATTAPKVRALTERPDVALSIDTGESPGDARSLSIRGVAAIDIVEGIPSEYLAQSSKGLADDLGEEGTAELERNLRKMYDQMARIRIAPRWARLYDFGGGRLPAFLAELAERAGFA